jgi:hypothetical protein
MVTLHLKVGAPEFYLNQESYTRREKSLRTSFSDEGSDGTTHSREF